MLFSAGVFPCVFANARSVFHRHLEIEIWYMCSVKYILLLQCRILATKRGVRLRTSQLSFSI
jgi:hypothetical protein